MIGKSINDYKIVKRLNDDAISGLPCYQIIVGTYIDDVEKKISCYTKLVLTSIKEGKEDIITKILNDVVSWTTVNEVGSPGNPRYDNYITLMLREPVSTGLALSMDNTMEQAKIVAKNNGHDIDDI